MGKIDTDVNLLVNPLGTTTIPAHHSVGLLTGLMALSLSIFSSSSFTGYRDRKKALLSIWLAGPGWQCSQAFVQGLIAASQKVSCFTGPWQCDLISFCHVVLHTHNTQLGYNEWVHRFPGSCQRWLNFAHHVTVLNKVSIKFRFHDNVFFSVLFGQLKGACYSLHPPPNKLGCWLGFPPLSVIVRNCSNLLTLLAIPLDC